MNNQLKRKIKIIHVTCIVLVNSNGIPMKFGNPQNAHSLRLLSEIANSPQLHISVFSCYTKKKISIKHTGLSVSLSLNLILFIAFFEHQWQNNATMIAKSTQKNLFFKVIINLSHQKIIFNQPFIMT